LDKFEDVVLVNPGGSPFGPTDQIENMLGQERTTLLANRSDIISSVYQQHSNKERTYYGPHTYNYSHAHDDEQFNSSPPEWTETAKMNVGLD